MRHRKSGRGFGRNSAQRKTMFRALVGSLVLEGRLHTTEAKAKELRRYAERAITLAKNAPTPETIAALSGEEAAKATARRVYAFRRARRLVHTDAVVTKLFGEVATGFQGREGGYTRVVKTGPRPGDNAPMAVIELVGSEKIGSDYQASAEA